MPARPSRNRVRRVPRRASYDRDVIDAILDEALVSHVGFVDDDHPFVIPTLHARVGDIVYIHGASASRMVTTLAQGGTLCLTATLLDGVVLARSAFHHSMNYRSVVVLGRVRLVEPESERIRALEAFTERMVPGRWAAVRPPSQQELKATRVLALPLTEASAKVRTGPPADASEDYELPVWAGVIPMRLARLDAQPDPALAEGIDEPDHVRAWRR